MPAPQQYVLLPSAARTTAPTIGALRLQDSFTGIMVVINVTAGTAGFSLQPAISGFTASGLKVPLLASIAAITATGQTVYQIKPGLTPAAGLTANGPITSRILVEITPADTKSVTYSVDAELLP